MAEETPTATAQKTAAEAMKAYEMSLEMGRAFMDAWAQNLQRMQAQGQAAAQSLAASAPKPAPEMPFGDVTRVWINAVTEATRRTQEAFAKGEAPGPDAYADIWSQAAAQVAQEVVKDAAFAKVTGQWVNATSGAKAKARDVAQERIRELGFATSGDVDEVGKRLIELERRVHDLTVLVEDRLLPALANAKEAKATKGAK